MNAKWETILKEVHNSQIIKVPLNTRRQQIPPNANKSKRCKYHRNYGHLIEECIVLKDQIEHLIR